MTNTTTIQITPIAWCIKLTLSHPLAKVSIMKPMPKILAIIANGVVINSNIIIN